MSKYFSGEEQSQSSKINDKPISEKTFIEKIKFYYNIIKDKIIIYPLERWLFALILFLIYVLRILLTRGYYCLTYLIGILFLNSFIGFISPLEDPEEYELNNDDSFLPQKNNEEFRPFQRKVKEYSFWELVCFTLLYSIFITFFKIFDVPVFWPLLLIYFIIVFILVMRKQIKHMIKYHYLPWDAGKTRYGK